MKQENRVNEKVLFKHNYLVIIVLLGILSACALSFTGKYYQDISVFTMLTNEISGLGISSLIIFIGLPLFYVKIWEYYKKCTHWVVHIVSALFSTFMLIGLSYSQQNNWDFIFGGKKQFVIACLVFIGYYVLFDILVSILYNLLHKMNFEYKDVSNKALYLLDKYSFIIPFIVIFICWLPYLIVHYPGSVPHDGYSQINQFFGLEPFTNAHPWVSTIFLGLLINIGLGVSDNFGIFLAVFILYCIQAICYAYVCKKLKDWNASVHVRLVTMLFYAFVPMFGEYAPVILKDNIFSALYALFLALCIDCCIKAHREEKTSFSFKKMLAMMAVGLSVCLMRNNGLYLVIPAIVVLLFFVSKKKIIYVLLVTASIFFSFQGISVHLAESLEIAPGSKREMLSIPFQQTARYIIEYPDDVTAEEYEAIEKILSYGELAERYDPERSDNVKNTYWQAATNEDLSNYFKAWFSMFFKHPDVYFQSLFNNTFGYYYPFYNYNGMATFQTYIKGEPIATGDFDIHYVFSDEVRNSIDSYAALWRVVPGLAQVMNPGTYTWILLLCFGYLIYCKRYKAMLVLISPLLNVAVCIASPVNGLLRYALPLMACIPIVVYWCLISNESLFKKE